MIQIIVTIKIIFIVECARVGDNKLCSNNSKSIFKKFYLKKE